MTTRKGTRAKVGDSKDKRSGGVAAGGRALLQRVGGVLDQGYRVLRAAASALVSDDVESDVLTLLSAHHRQVEKLFSEIEGLGDGSDQQRAALAEELGEALVQHAAVEERFFYPAVRTAQTEDLVLESAEEHLAMKRTLLDLLATAPADETFSAKLATLKEQVQHHAKEEEEGKLFPLVRELTSRELREAMAQEIIAGMVEVQEGPDARQRLREEVERAAT
jgi:hemerythrin superfamily protein